MTVTLALVLAASLVIGVSHYWDPTLPLAGKDPLRSFWKWAATGIAVPVFIWCVFNAGFGISPLLPQISLGWQSGAGLQTFAEYTAGATFVIVTWWAAVSMGWIACEIAQRAPDRRLLLNSIFVALLLALPVSAVVLFVLQQAGIGLAIAVAAGAVTHATRGLAPVAQPPIYSRAMARIAFDRFNDAEWEIIKELEAHENDFDGWMMLAELYATHFNDLASAERTICELCDEPSTNASQISVALNRLADWHLRAKNKENAQWALNQICRKLPGTHMAKMAEARIRLLDEPAPEPHNGAARPTTVNPAAPVIQLKKQTASPRVTTQTHDEPQKWNAPTIQLRAKPSVDPREAALEEANRCVERLKANPNDTAERERFAVILAEQLGKVDEALSQLELLVTGSRHTDEQRAGWITIQAGWQLRLLRNTEAAKSLLQRIVNDFPGTSHAFDAQRQLYMLQLENKVRQKRKQ